MRALGINIDSYKVRVDVQVALENQPEVFSYQINFYSYYYVYPEH